MSNINIIRAWKDEEYRNSLNKKEYFQAFRHDECRITPNINIIRAWKSKNHRNSLNKKDYVQAFRKDECRIIAI